MISRRRWSVLHDAADQSRTRDIPVREAAVEIGLNMWRCLPVEVTHRRYKPHRIVRQLAPGHQAPPHAQGSAGSAAPNAWPHPGAGSLVRKARRKAAPPDLLRDFSRRVAGRWMPGVSAGRSTSCHQLQGAGEALAALLMTYPRRCAKRTAFEVELDQVGGLLGTSTAIFTRTISSRETKHYRATACARRRRRARRAATTSAVVEPLSPPRLPGIELSTRAVAPQCNKPRRSSAGRIAQPVAALCSGTIVTTGLSGTSRYTTAAQVGSGQRGEYIGGTVARQYALLRSP